MLNYCNLRWKIFVLICHEHLSDDVGESLNQRFESILWIAWIKLIHGNDSCGDSISLPYEFQTTHYLQTLVWPNNTQIKIITIFTIMLNFLTPANFSLRFCAYSMYFPALPKVRDESSVFFCPREASQPLHSTSKCLSFMHKLPIMHYSDDWSASHSLITIYKH